MNWIKLFEEFSDVESLIRDIEDICAELNDEGISISCEHHGEIDSPRILSSQFMSKRREYLSLLIEKTPVDFDDYTDEFTFGEIEEVVYRILDFMNSSGWKPSYVLYDGESYRVENFDAKQWIQKNLKSEYVLAGLQIDFIRK